MIFTPLAISGAYTIDLERREDERGWFARTWCADEFVNHGLSPRFVQCSMSHNKSRGTLRGLHYQAAPHQEAKLIHCIRGSIFDVLVDLREESPTYRQWHGEVLSRQGYRMLYIPEGCAHGFITLEEDTDVLYQMSEFHHPECAHVIAWNDAEIGIRWPIQPVLLSHQDRATGQS